MVSRTTSQVNRNQDYIIGTVVIVDMTRGMIQIEDRFGTQYQITLHLKDPLFAVPVVGEGWLIRRTGIDWFLDKRIDTGSETPNSSLSPGDRRLEYNSLVLDGTSVILSESSASSFREQLIPYISGAGKTTVTDLDFPSTPLDGTLAIHYDSTALRVYLSVRAASTWHVLAGPIA